MFGSTCLGGSADGRFSAPPAPTRFRGPPGAARFFLDDARPKRPAAGSRVRRRRRLRRSRSVLRSVLRSGSVRPRVRKVLVVASFLVLLVFPHMILAYYSYVSSSFPSFLRFRPPLLSFPFLLSFFAQLRLVLPRIICHYFSTYYYASSSTSSS